MFFSLLWLFPLFHYTLQCRNENSCMRRAARSELIFRSRIYDLLGYGHPRAQRTGRSVIYELFETEISDGAADDM